MKKFYDKVLEVLPVLWGLLLILITTTAGVTLAITTIKWLLRVVGVI